MNKKQIIIVAMCLVVCLMIVGYSILGQNLNIDGTADIESNWNILFTSVTAKEQTSGATFTSAPTISGTTLTFGLDLKAPGDGVKLDVTVANKGTLNAIINNIEAKKGANEVVKIEITGIKKGDKLGKGESKTFEIYITFDSSVTDQPIMDSDMLSVSVDFVQDVGQTITSEDLEIVSMGLRKKILSDNKAEADTNIDFSKISSDTNGKGLYYTSTNTEDDKVTYYFRGKVENNYVTFAGFTWRIIRINEDESIRLIKEGLLDASLIDSSTFNNKINDPTYVGYMYGTVGSTTYVETHKNINSSDVKIAVDQWYKDNLINYSDYLADAGFCGDRSIAIGSGIGQDSTNYGVYNRLTINKKPQFVCPQENDLYTTTTATKGNKALTYPIGLITADEISYAGSVLGVTNNEIYIRKGGYNLWTMTPSYSSTNQTVNIIFMYDGRISGAYLDHKLNIRPVINLKSTIEITKGDGTKDNPYIIKTN